MLDSPQLNRMVTTWLVHSEVSKDVKLFNELPRHDPEVGWSAILKVLSLPESEMHLPALSESIKILINYHGEKFIERIEAQSVIDPLFKGCLSHIRLNPGIRISKQLLERLAYIAGTTVESGGPQMERIFDQPPDLSEALYATPFISEKKNIPFFTNGDLDHIALSWIKHRETFWAQEEVERIIRDEFVEYAFNVVMVIYGKSFLNEHLCALGSGPIEDLLKKNGAFIIDRIEQQASSDPRFRVCLSYVWPTNIAVDVWKRVLNARGNEPQRS